MTYTIDRIKELVPEATKVEKVGSRFSIIIGHSAILSDSLVGKALLTTRAEVERLRKALEPFAKFGKKLDGRRGTPTEGDWYSLDAGSESEAVLTIEHFKDARHALEKGE